MLRSPSKAWLPITLLLSLGSTSCLQGESGDLPAIAGPIDATYLLVSRTCEGTSITTEGTISRFVVKGVQGTYSDTLIDNCVIVTHSNLTYPAPGVFVSTPQQVTCSYACSGAECSESAALPAPQTWNYTTRGTSLLLTQSGTHPGCPASEVAVFSR